MTNLIIRRWHRLFGMSSENRKSTAQNVRARSRSRRSCWSRFIEGLESRLALANDIYVNATETYYYTTEDEVGTNLVPTTISWWAETFDACSGQTKTERVATLINLQGIRVDSPVACGDLLYFRVTEGGGEFYQSYLGKIGADGGLKKYFPNDMMPFENSVSHLFPYGNQLFFLAFGSDDRTRWYTIDPSQGWDTPTPVSDPTPTGISGPGYTTIQVSPNWWFENPDSQVASTNPDSIELELPGGPAVGERLDIDDFLLTRDGAPIPWAPGSSLSTTASWDYEAAEETDGPVSFDGRTVVESISIHFGTIEDIAGYYEVSYVGSSTNLFDLPLQTRAPGRTGPLRFSGQ